MMATDSTFSKWVYSHYFEYTREIEKNITVRCTLCAGGRPRELSTAKNSTSNLKKHLERVHSNHKLEAKRPLASEETEDDGARKSKQLKLDFTRLAVKILNPGDVRRLVAEYVVEDALPLSTIESSAFQKLISKIPVGSSDKRVLPDRKTFAKDLDKAYEAMEKELKKKIDAQDYVSATADIWSVNNKSFMGVTIHWIDAGTLKREKAAIACRRFRGRHTYDAVATELEDIFSRYGLNKKVTACVTDNGSNFVKAFKEFQIAEPESDEEQEEETGEVTFTDLHNVLTTTTDDDGQTICELPPHHRCAAHTLNLIANNEVDKWLASNPDSRAVYRSATGKCAALWTKASRSTVASEYLEEVSEKKLIVPTVTRWNSFYDAYARIIEMPLAIINKLCTQLHIKCMNDKEYQFLTEYCLIMKPFTAALDILQGEDTCFYGTLLPTLEILMAKTRTVKNGLSKMTGELPDIIVEAIKKRFAATLDSKDALLAAVSLPKFKLRWLDDSNAPMSVETEVIDYLKSAPVMESLHHFPRVKKVALRYNAATPSSAPVERLFSVGGLVLTPKRNRLGDERFQKLVLLRYNKYFSSKE
ncbi:uncharacterized protein LOC121637653 isoform X2 [Melanotaenia boesemani]|uniref:uncharacterized protein LOC121637653 isoform X2 n=1 Tax=Melanotaenia boesemani TaxID=1250792 RepID=UPI001C058BD4|nr:uncharacterized protein LOC121637653 isoform X2 [Melanotaenia boesemani]